MAKSKLQPVGEVVYIPLNRIVRCRWRDEEDSPDKVRVAKERIGRQGFRGHLDGVILPGGKIEQLNGHNRVTACRELGITEIPFVVKPYTDEEALDIFLSDNMKEDAQSTGWALGAVRTVIPYLISQNMSKSEAQARLADKIGLQVKDIEKLSEMNEALASGILTPAVKRLPVPYNAVEFWRKLQELMSCRHVSLEDQVEILEGVLAGADHRRRITNLFSDLLRNMTPLKVVQPKPKKSPFISVCRYLEQVAEILQQHVEDFGEQEIQIILTKARFVNSLLPTVLSDSQKAISETLAKMEEEDNDVQSTEV